MHVGNMHVGNIGAAFAAYIAAKFQSASKKTKAQEVEPQAYADAVTEVEMNPDAGLTEARTKLKARDAQVGLSAQALNIANSLKNSAIAALIR
jgi:hypothetical protein